MACVREGFAFFFFFKSPVVRSSMTLRSFCHIWPELQGESVPWRETGCSTALWLPHTSEPPADGKAQRVREEPPHASGLFWDSHCQLLWSRGGYLCCLQQFKASFFPALQSLACFSPTHVFYLVLATFEDWRWVDLGNDPTNWQSWPQGMNKILTGSNITVTQCGPASLVLCSWQSRAVPLHKQLSSGGKCASSQPPCSPLFHSHGDYFPHRLQNAILLCSAHLNYFINRMPLNKGLLNFEIHKIILHSITLRIFFFYNNSNL